MKNIGYLIEMVWVYFVMLWKELSYFVRVFIDEHFDTNTVSVKFMNSVIRNLVNVRRIYLDMLINEDLSIAQKFYIQSLDDDIKSLEEYVIETNMNSMGLGPI